MSLKKNRCLAELLLASANDQALHITAQQTTHHRLLVHEPRFYIITSYLRICLFNTQLFETLSGASQEQLLAGCLGQRLQDRLAALFMLYPARPMG
jgi:hypothetical protein